MKNFSKLFLPGILFFSFLILVSCSETNKKEATAVPKDAAFVLVVDGKSLSEKSGIDDFTQTNAYKKLMEQMSSDEIEHLKQFDYILKDVNESGVGINDTYLVFMKMDMGDPIVGINLPVIDRAKLENLMNKAVDDSQKELVIEKNADISVLNTPNEDVIICWNDNQLLMITSDSKSSDDLSQMGMELLQQHKSKSIFSNSHFNDFYSEHKDLSFWLNYGHIMDNMAPAQQMMASQIPFDFKGMYISGFVSFEKGKVDIKYHTEMSEKMKEYLEKYPVINPDFDLAALEAIPQKSFLNFESSLNFYEYYRLLLSMYKEKQINVDTYSKQIEKELGVSLEELLKSISGEIAVSIQDIKMVEKVDPNKDYIEGAEIPRQPEIKYTAVLRLKDELVWSIITDRAQQFGLQQTADGYYSVPNANMYFTYKDNNIVFTNDLELMQKVQENGKVEPNMVESDAAKSLKNFPSYMEINLDAADYPEEVLQYYHFPVEDFLKPYKRIVISASDMSNVEAVIEMKDDSQNALRIILNNMDENMELVSQR